jgi:pyruvate carboxylase
MIDPFRKIGVIPMPAPTKSPKPVRSVLVANRSGISIRVMRAAAEMGIRMVATYSNEDRFALHRFKADESYLVGEGGKPVAEKRPLAMRKPYLRLERQVHSALRSVATFC